MMAPEYLAQLHELFETAWGEMGIWINALLVLPEHQRRGLASRLILVAGSESESKSETERRRVSTLFVHTEFAELYAKPGWQLVESTSSNNVLMKTVGV